MTFLQAIYQILIGPLYLFFEQVFLIVDEFLPHPGFTIIVLSLIVNLLVLPLYRRADAMQKEERDVEAKIAPGVAHIKKTFRGDERFMMLQTYYRQNNYSPFNVLKGSLSLLLQVPFFMAAYRFLSSLETLKDEDFFFIEDLGAPDHMLVIAGVAINVLPILMTLINYVSGFIYTRGMPLKSKLQLYVIATVFLVLLYDSPAGLVFYWTLNNIFSLVKNIFYKLKDPKLVLSVIAAIIGLFDIVWILFIDPLWMGRRIIVLLLAGVALMAPLALRLIGKKHTFKLRISRDTNGALPVFLSSGIYMAVLTGVLIPSAALASSPQEFINLIFMRDPNEYILYSATVAFGLFVVWFSLFYYLADALFKRLLSICTAILAAMLSIDYFMFSDDMGTMSSYFKFDADPIFENKSMINNVLIVLAAAVVIVVLNKFLPRVLRAILISGVIAVIAMSVGNINKITTEYRKVSAFKVETDSPHVTLSKDGQNVVVIMLDRALGAVVPYIMNERPELERQFDGFTYYPNTISYGPFTNFGVPGVFGGYEYSAAQMNLRSDELLMDKHDEALMVMPVLFGENGYHVTLLDPTYVHYNKIPDLSMFDDYPYIDAYITKASFSQNDEEAYDHESKEAIREHNIVCYSFFKAAPIFARDYLYNYGSYNYSVSMYSEASYDQIAKSVSMASGISAIFMDSYTELITLPAMTMIDNDSTGEFVLMTNNTTHEPSILQEPEYTPSQSIDNREYDAAHEDREYIDGRRMRLDNIDQMSHYQINMAAYIALGEWFDYLRAEGVYDNTRIIIVADHGRDLHQFDDMMFFGGDLDVEWINPVLMVKDFGARGFTTDYTFMTNADVPTIATNDIIDSPVNPFTGNPITSDSKIGAVQQVIISEEFEPDPERYQYYPGDWYSVHDDIFVEENWEYIGYL